LEAVEVGRTDCDSHWFENGSIGNEKMPFWQRACLAMFKDSKSQDQQQFSRRTKHCLDANELMKARGTQQEREGRTQRLDANELTKARGTQQGSEGDAPGSVD
jgi:hypothetical protein